jgi:hypothetical protein
MIVELDYTPRTADQVHPVKITGITSAGALVPERDKLINSYLNPFAGESFLIQRLEQRKESMVMSLEGIPSVKLELEELGSWRRALGYYRASNGRSCSLEEMPDGRILIKNEYQGLIPEEGTTEVGDYNKSTQRFEFLKGSLAWFVEPKGTQSGRLVIWFPDGNGSRHWEKLN